MLRDLQRRVERMEAAARPVDAKPWVRVIVDGETEAEAYEKQTGAPYPADPSTLPHNVIFRVIV
jgi:hypothetical protein